MIKVRTWDNVATCTGVDDTIDTAGGAVGIGKSWIKNESVVNVSQWVLAVADRMNSLPHTTTVDRM